jgi:hypothetical protein
MLLLDMSGNDLGDATAAALADSLSANNKLQTLHVATASFSDSAGKMIFDGLAANQCLTALDLSANALGDGAAASLCATLEGTDSLEGRRDAVGLVNRFDADGDLSLNADEFARLMVARNGGLAVDTARVAETFAAVDVDAAGSVNVAKLEEWLRAGAPAGEAFASLQYDRGKMEAAFRCMACARQAAMTEPGLLSKDEFHHAMTEMASEHLTDQMFETMWQVRHFRLIFCTTSASASASD